MDQSRLRSFEAQCTQEEAPACQTRCPLHVEAREFIRLMAAEKYGEARKMLDRTMPLAAVTARLCSGPCTEYCRRAELDQGVNLPMLERACVGVTSSKKPFPLPGSGKKVAVAGAGLSSLVFAYETAKKGHEVQIFYSGRPGGSLLGVSAAELPPEALQEVLSVLDALKVRFVELPEGSFDRNWTAGILRDQLALYIGLDDPGLAGDNPVLRRRADGSCVLNPLTMETDDPKIFAGGHAESFIEAASDGKKAASSVDRMMQGVAPGTAREKDGVFDTRLYTSLEGIEKIPAQAPADPLSPTLEEARREAGRCIQCECLECVKNCAYLKSFKGYPKKYAREIYNTLAVVQGLRLGNTMANSCAECGLCASICPNEADTGNFCRTAREEMVSTGHMPPSAHEFALEDMAYSNAPDIAFIRHAPGTDRSAWLFFPGCQLPASMPLETEALYAHLRERLSGGVGLYFACCGAPAAWGGRRAHAERIAAVMRKTWQKAGSPEVILACASCLKFFSEYLADLPARSLWSLLPELPLPEGAARAPSALALHDPCASREFTDSQTGVRKLLALLGQEVEELELGRGLTRCCGYGGLADQANPALGREFARDRAGDSANPMLSYCSMCRDRIRAVGKDSVHLLSLLFPRGGFKLEEAARRPAPGISRRQDGRLLFREHLLKTLWQELPVRNEAMESVKLIVTGEAAPKLEARRVLHNEIKKVLLHEKSTQFLNASTGHYLACFKPRNVTYWVEYSRDGDGAYVIHDAYCHRMTVPGVPEADRAACAACDGCSNPGPDAEISGGAQ